MVKDGQNDLTKHHVIPPRNSQSQTIQHIFFFKPFFPSQRMEWDGQNGLPKHMSLSKPFFKPSKMIKDEQNDSSKQSVSVVLRRCFLYGTSLYFAKFSVNWLSVSKRKKN